MFDVHFQQMENADAERDVYDELLTQAEIQGNVNQVNGESHVVSLIVPSLLLVRLGNTSV